MKVSDAWPGLDDPSALGFDTCFTAWLTNPRRILPAATSASSTSVGSSSDNVLKGYISKNLTHCFVSGLETNPWWRVDLGVSKKVAQVRVYVRQDDTVGGFFNVEARLGESTVYEDNAVFDFKAGEPVANAEVLFTPSKPLSGQYFFLQSQGSSSDNKLAFCIVEILEQKLDPVLRNCKDAYNHGNHKSGVYTIYPYTDCLDPVTVYCDMDTDGGGWAVFQRRRDITPRIDFYRTWDEYARGFGDVAKGEFWLGNEHIHALTNQTNNELRVDLEDFAGGTRWAKYSSFFVDDRDHFFTMTLSGYTGNAGNSLALHSGQKFSAKDRDLDSSAGFCSSKYYAGWWYAACHEANLNGEYLGGDHSLYARGIVWYKWRGHYYSLKAITLMIRPVT
ncbi:techylectin-5A-like [Penaeus monodon]|uniref:techylectin-5A-like n=1 Tax=Penaeus monodon TaxID=6687 RepID=UPI0018A77ECA|nr:techylectin-5A-like [Penaeus monodon]